MIYFKGDIVKTKLKETGEIIDTWGIARDWCKVKLDHGETAYFMAEDLELISRYKDKKKRGRR